MSGHFDLTGLFDLTGRVALVTGAGRGLGAAMARALAQAGATVVLAGRSAQPLADVAKSITDSGGRADIILCDVTQHDAVEAAVAQISAQQGGIDILVNNAGMTDRAAFTDVSEAQWDQMIEVNLKGPFLMTRAVLPQMISRGGGKVINILSVVGELGRPMIVPYSASKGGLRMLTRALATEVACHNIQVNGIGPGYFLTEMNRGLISDQAYFNERSARIPAGRWAEAQELGGAVVFLASKASDYVTGQVLYVDGGLTASF
jgi:gluconate 5-dehydrogenase